jgi:hypothetical protein
LAAAKSAVRCCALVKFDFRRGVGARHSGRPGVARPRGAGPIFSH